MEPRPPAAWAWPRAAPHGEDVILGKLAGIVLVLLVFAGGLVGYSEYRFRELSDSVDADLATYRRQRWERPTLRGAAGDGNAALELQRALAGFQPLADDARDQLAAQLYYGQALTPEQRAMIDAHGPMLDKLRASAATGWAMTELSLERCADSPGPSYPLIMDAVLVMLGRAAGAGADECLVVATDAIRLGQDLVPGARLEAASVAMRIASVTAPVIARCAQNASLDALARAARELGILASHAPSAGSGVEVADLCARIELRRLAELSPAPGAAPDDSPLQRLRRRPALLEAAAPFANPSRWRALSPDKYPASRDQWMQELDWRSRSSLPLVPTATAEVDGWLYDDMRGQAIVRALAVGTATLAERARRKKLPREPTNLGDPAFRDPYNGLPLKWRINLDGSELTLWSVGENMRDDKGSADWMPQAPVDVVVHFRIGPLEAEGKPRSTSTARAAAP